MQKTKIVCTIGPASESKTQLKRLINAGMNVARLNFSHGSYESHAQIIKNVRAASKELNQQVAIIQDLCGPRIRVGDVPEKGIKIKKGQTVKFSDKKTSKDIIPLQCTNLEKYIKTGHSIRIQDGLYCFTVAKVSKNIIYAKALGDALILPHKNLNVPNTFLSIPFPTKKDRQDLRFGLTQMVDWVAISFVRDANDIKQFKKFLIQEEEKTKSDCKKNCKPCLRKHLGAACTKIIAKIETKQAVENIDEILAEVDAIMVARGDLGIELNVSQVPLEQKRLIQKCLEMGKPIITATQMLESMIENPVPTRAEISDIANAILDGTDAIMLSGESSIGKYPVEAVSTMTDVISEVEAYMQENKLIYGFHYKHNLGKSPETESISHKARMIAVEMDAKALITVTTSGYTARAMARHKPNMPIIALTPSPRTRNQLVLSWGVFPFQIPAFKTFEQLLNIVDKIIKTHKFLKKGDRFVITCGYPFGTLRKTNLLEVHQVK